MTFVFDLPEARAGSDWKLREGEQRKDELLIALLSRFNHDLRTPLNTVVGWTHLLQQGLVDSGRSKHVADVLARNTREQTVLLDEFVDDARAVLGVLKADPVALSITDVVTAAVDRAAPVASLHGVSIHPTIEAQDARVLGDERRLPRLVYRLLVAVARRTREAGVIEIGATREGEMVCLRLDGPVRDDADWPDATLLDLRLSSFVAALHEADLSIDGKPGRAAIALRLPVLD